MNITTSKIITFHLVSVSETESSSRMEKEGFIKVLEKVSSYDFQIESITTDQHTQIKKYIRENTNLKHQFDIWHVGKKIKLKLIKVMFYVGVCYLM
jgi:hypothetical protein